MCCVFFFQAEDGIRYGRVTGVQTCALPILACLSQDQDRDQQASAPAGIHVLHGTDRTNYPLAVSVDDRGDGFAVTADGVAPAVPEQLCALLVTALDGLVTALEQAPTMPLHQIAVLEPEQRAQVLAGWNDTAAPVPAATVPELIAERAART